MTIHTLAGVKVGDMLPPLTLPALNRTTLALFAGASGDHMPLHIDTDFARKAGMPDVFGHGMLSMAYLGRLLTDWAPQAQLRQFNARFGGITHLGNIMTCSGSVVATNVQDGALLLKLELQARTQHGDLKTVGDAIIALPA
jgi:acyl dehydratase